jgi:outer membrane immunogenic protein
MQLKHVVGILLGSTAFSGAAFADGWNGAYLGIQGGYASLPSTTLAIGKPVDQDATLSGGLVGIDIGFDHQMSNNFVVGVIADWSVSNASGSGLDDQGNPFSLTLNSLGRAQIRAGMSFGAANENLLYIGGGLAFGSVTAPGPEISSSNSHVGYVVSAGFEHKISPSLSIKAEASYVDLGKKTYNAGETVKLGGLLATVGVNFHF